MKDKQWLNPIAGSITGLFVGGILITEGKYFVNHILASDPAGIGISIRILSYLAAAVVFAVIFWKSCKNKKQNLTSYYLQAVLVSATAVIAILYLVTWILALLIKDRLLAFLNTQFGIFFQYNMIYITFVFLVIVFAGVFSVITQRKVAYVRLLSREIKKIENEGFGKKIEVRGNDELAELCTSINHMSEELLEKEIREKQNEKRKNELITNISHDLRSPLTSIIGYVELLKTEGVGQPEKFNEYINVVERRLHGLNILINELFEFTKLNNTEINLNYESFDLNALLNHLAEEYAILYEMKGMTFIKNIDEKPCYMDMDIEKMARAIQNLLDNAVKYAKEKSTVRITMETKEIKEKRQIKICISNELREEETIEVEDLFERCYKGDSARNDTERSGLGLAITKRIVELHGGTIKAEMEGNLIHFEMNYAMARKIEQV